MNDAALPRGQGSVHAHLDRDLAALEDAILVEADNLRPVESLGSEHGRRAQRRSSRDTVCHRVCRRARSASRPSAPLLRMAGRRGGMRK
eukprot:scaffold212125_cov30-Tisochrysis_lutea.AAC.1